MSNKNYQKNHVDTSKELELDVTQDDESFLNITEHESFAFLRKMDLSKIRRYVIEYSSLIIFTALQIYKPILVRVAHREAEKDAVFLGSVLVFATEVFKIIFCFVVIPIKHRSVKMLFNLIYESFTINKIETLKICVPALIYVIQNNLYYFALERIDATLFAMTYQLQSLTTAILMILIMNRRFTNLQWLALTMSMVGVIIVRLGNLSTLDSNASSDIPDQILGFIAVLIMCCTNAFGGVYLEAVMKKSGEDIFLQNIRLGLLSLPLSAFTLISDHKRISERGFFVGWNYSVWLIVLTSALGGIVVSAVIRYTDNIKKSFCQALALGGTAFISVYLGDSAFSFYLLAGVSLVVISVVLYASSRRKETVLLMNQSSVYNHERLIEENEESTRN